MGKFRVVGVTGDQVQLGVVAGQREYNPEDGLEYVVADVDASELEDAIAAARVAGKAAAAAAKKAPPPALDPRDPRADSSPFAGERPPLRASS